MPNQNIKEPTKEEFDNKTQLFQKKLQCYHVSLAAPTKDLTPNKSLIIVGTNNTIQNAMVSLL